MREDKNNKTVIIWLLGIILFFILGLSAFFVQQSYSGMNDRVGNLESGQKKLEQKNLIVNAKLDILLRQAGISDLEIERIEKKYGENK